MKISEEAVRAASAVFTEQKSQAWLTFSEETRERLITSWLPTARAALEAAAPHLTPAVPKQAELAEWLREIFSTDADPEGTTWETAAEELQALLALYHVAPE